MSKTARCDECNRIVTLIKFRYAFRRHNKSKGKLCPGSWEAPDVISQRVAERRVQSTTAPELLETTHAATPAAS